MKILVTGGCGFIGSNFVKYMIEKGFNIINVDKHTYAGSGKNIEHMNLDKHKNYKLYKTDICDKKSIEEIILEEKPEIIVNFAAESHVDKSIKDPSDFIMTNIFGVYSLLEVVRKNNIKLFVQISTDEVYGSLSSSDLSSKETDILKPRSPYSASKAAAENIAMSYFATFNVPVIITRSSNNYGQYQFPEKIVPLFITNLTEGKKVPLMYSKENPGLNVRDWTHVEDNCRAIDFIIRNGKTGEIYNIGGGNERTNIEITRLILKKFRFGDEMIDYIPHRLGHDFRYSLNDEKIKKLGFERKFKNFEQGLEDTIEWYKKNRGWWEPLRKNLEKK